MLNAFSPLLPVGLLRAGREAQAAVFDQAQLRGSDAASSPRRVSASVPRLTASRPRSLRSRRPVRFGEGAFGAAVQQVRRR